MISCMQRTNQHKMLRVSFCLSSDFDKVKGLIKVIKENHPYEEVGIDIYPLIDLDYFKKKTVCDSNCVTQTIFTDLLRSVSTMTSNPASWTAEDILSRQSESNSLNNCPIAVIKYTCIQFAIVFGGYYN